MLNIDDPNGQQINIYQDLVPVPGSDAMFRKWQTSQDEMNQFAPTPSNGQHTLYVRSELPYPPGKYVYYDQLSFTLDLSVQGAPAICISHRASAGWRHGYIRLAARAVDGDGFGDGRHVTYPVRRGRTPRRSHDQD